MTEEFFSDPLKNIKVDLDNIDKERLPSFSIIVPTYKDFMGLGRTLCNIVYQSPPAKNALREVIVVGDGYEKEAYDMCASAQKFAEEEGQNVKVWYFNTKAHTGGGNVPRAAGLKRAKQEWVMFWDAGTSVCHNCIASLIAVIQEQADARLITWDIVQLIDPVPLTSVCQLVAATPRRTGLSYVIPGVSACVKREDAQSVEWPNVKASDWAYFSQLWEKMYGKGDEETDEIKERMNKEIVLIPWVMTVAYGARSERKERMPATMEAYEGSNYHLGWSHAANTIEEPNGGSSIVGPDGQPVSST